MNSLEYTSLECNSKFQISFSGGDLSSDGGLLLLKEFIHKTGFDDLVKNLFHTKDSANFRRHTDAQNLMQMIYQTLAAYFRDDCADELTKDPVMTAVLSKDALASQPTLSRFFNRMDESTLVQLNQLQREMRKSMYSLQRPEHVLFDLDSTLLNTYGSQEGESFNYHYQAHGYHPLLCYDGMTGDLMKAELRDGSMYCSNGAGSFMEDLLNEFQEDFPDILCYMRGDSGFASPEVYEALEKKDCKYAIRLKQNPKLMEMIKEQDSRLYEKTKGKSGSIDYAVTYGEFMYQAASWSHPRRVVYKIEKPSGQFIHLYTFIVTTREDLDARQVIRYYCARGKMENFIKEGKNGFGFAAVSSKQEVVNANRFQVHCLAYNLFNWFRRLVMPEEMSHYSIDTFRIKLLKIAVKVVRRSRYVYFRLCSSCPYQREFCEILSKIRNLKTCISA